MLVVSSSYLTWGRFTRGGEQEPSSGLLSRINIINGLRQSGCSLRATATYLSLLIPTALTNDTGGLSQIITYAHRIGTAY